MLDLRHNCELCDRDLAPDSGDAGICSYESPSLAEFPPTSPPGTRPGSIRFIRARCSHQDAARFCTSAGLASGAPPKRERRLTLSIFPVGPSGIAATRMTASGTHQEAT